MRPSKKQFEQERFYRLAKAEYLGLGEEVLDMEFANPLEPKTEEDKDNPLKHFLRTIRKPENFSFTCKQIFNIELAPFQLVILQELWYRKYPMLIATRGGSKSFLLALYSMLRALINQGSKIVIVGAAFRQAKVIFEYCEHIWYNAPILRDMVGVGGRSGPRRDIDRCTCTIGDSVIVALPLGTGEKIRGQRANVICCDEFSTVPKSIYEEVVSGFAAVHGNPVESMKRAARIRVMKRMGKWTPEMADQESRLNQGNQAIIAGTANYTFNHFADYWKQYKGIVESNGDPKKLVEVFNGKIPTKFDWRNYSIIRLPVELLPEDFMDEEHVARAQVTTSSGTYAIEYGAVFAGDSNGFFRRSLIEGCIVRPENVYMMLPGVEVFAPLLQGRRGLRYVFSVDAASESDNFAISIVEINGNHRRTVFCWTTTRFKHQERIRYGIVKEKNFYAYAARKIRDLMKVFNCVRIAMDSQGGGRAILEALHDMDKLEPGELPIWEVRSEDPQNPNPDDDKPGLHLVELIHFAKADWVSEANHGLKKDMEDKVLLFPYFDPIRLYEANQDDKKTGRIIIKDGVEIQLQDTFEDVVMEIEAMKDELVTIVHTQTPKTNRDHWDTPEIKQAGGKKGRLRKDRYSALLMANMVARQMMRAPAPARYEMSGGFAKDMVGKSNTSLANMPMYDAPDWFTNSEENYKFIGQAVKRGGSGQQIGVFRNR